MNWKALPLKMGSTVMQHAVIFICILIQLQTACYGCSYGMALVIVFINQTQIKY